MSRRASAWRRGRTAPTTEAFTVGIGRPVAPAIDETERRLLALLADESARGEYRDSRRASRPVLVLEALVASRGVTDPVVVREIVRRVLDRHGGLPAGDETQMLASARAILETAVDLADQQAAIR